MAFPILGALKLAINAGSHIYKKKQETKMAMADAQHMAATKMARGLPILVLAWGVWSDDPAAMEKIKTFFEHFQALPTWFTNLWILVCASIFGIKGTQIFRNGKK